jgi:hypothetical protein
MMVGKALMGMVCLAGQGQMRKQGVALHLSSGNWKLQANSCNPADIPANKG